VARVAALPLVLGPLAVGALAAWGQIRGAGLSERLPATSDKAPCDRTQVVRLGHQVQYCPLFRPDVPVYDSPDQGNAARQVGTLNSGGQANWFVGQSRRSSYTSDGAANRWWAYTLSDGPTGQWGWVPEVFFTGGKDDERDAGLHLCDTRGNACRP
jgi:hypothetical protein